MHEFESFKGNVKKTFNTSLSNLILETKVEKRCELLLNNYSITETAQALAFYSV